MSDAGGGRTLPAAARNRAPAPVENLSVVGRPLDDAELVGRAQRGDLHADGELVSRYQGIALAGHVLLWRRRGLTFRLEGELTRDEAVRSAGVVS